MILRTMMIGTLFLAGFAVLDAPAKAQEGQRMPGSDRDRHGCIGSAGYSWCRYTGQCERPWVLAKERGFANELQSFKRFCNRKPKP